MLYPIKKAVRRQLLEEGKIVFYADSILFTSTTKQILEEGKIVFYADSILVTLTTKQILE